jgi:YidC/Oxa1 family membrane protein insertase
LPLLLQMPVFFALYQALMRSVVLKGANFLWIKDLSEPDRLITFSKALPLMGNTLNILPILMAIIMFVQQKFSMVATNSEQAEQQKMMLIIMPVMFGFIFYQMPSGLVLYWMVNSLLTAVFQIRANKAK